MLHLVQRALRLTISPAVAMLLLVSPVRAQQPAAPMSDQQMQAMMAYMQAIQACSNGVDESTIQGQADQLHQEVAALCAAGKRDAAQAKAMAFAGQLADDPALKAMHECMAKADKLRPDIPGMAPPAEIDPTRFDANHHVCDGP